MEPVMIYQPSAEQNERITWYGGESSYLHFEKRFYDAVDHTFVWQELNVQSLMEVPTQIKDMLLVMEDFYHQCVILEMERRQAMCD